MACCGETKEKIDLKNEKFPELFIHIGQDKINFNSDFGQFNIDNKEIEIENESKLKKDIKILNQKYLEGKDILNELNSKINEIDKKIKLMEKILIINEREKEYLNEMSKKLNLNNQKI